MTIPVTTFKSYAQKNVGTTGATLLTGPAATQVTIIGVTVANTSAQAVYADVVLNKGGTDYYIIKGALVYVANSLVVVGGDQKVVVQTGDVVKVVSSVDGSVDAIVSTMELS